MNDAINKLLIIIYCKVKLIITISSPKKTKKVSASIATCNLIKNITLCVFPVLKKKNKIIYPSL